MFFFLQPDSSNSFTSYFIFVDNSRDKILTKRLLFQNIHSPLPCERPTSLHEPKPPSMWKEGDRLRWRIENSLACESELHSNALRCTALPISRTRRLSPTASAVPPLSEKEGFCGVFCHSFLFLNLVPYFSLWSTTSNKRF